MSVGKSIVLIIGGLVVAGMCLWQGVIKREITWRSGGRIRSGRVHTFTGSDAVMVGALGVVAGVTVAVVGFVSLRKAKRQPPSYY